jgi:hypothetical protein
LPPPPHKHTQRNMRSMTRALMRERETRGQRVGELGESK